jgi:hypothetical protein
MVRKGKHRRSSTPSLTAMLLIPAIDLKDGNCVRLQQGNMNVSTVFGEDPAQMAHGISIALYNTAFGIGIAIPALIFYRHFKNKVDTFVVEMEQRAGKLVDIVHGERSA